MDENENLVIADPSGLFYKVGQRKYFVSTRLSLTHKESGKMTIKDKVSFLDRILPLIKKYIDVDLSLVQFRFCDLKDRKGRAFPDRIEFSVPHIKTKLQMITVTAHELVHIEQYQQKRLKFEYTKNFENIYTVFEGKDYPYLDDMPFDYEFTDDDLKKYNNQPWEKEAIKRQRLIQKEVRKLI